MARFPQALQVTLTAAVLGVSLMAPATAAPADPSAPRPVPRPATSAAKPAAQLKLPRLRDGLASLDVRLSPRLTEKAEHGAKTVRLPTTTYSMVGVSWKGEQKAPSVAVRVHTPSGWKRWQHLPLQTDVPDGEEGAKSRRGTQAVWVGRSTGVQVRVRGERPKGLRLTLMNTGPSQKVTAPARKKVDGRKVGRRPRWAPQPVIYSRAKWGANNAWRNGRPSYNTVLKQVHIHHTATTNNYSRGDVPGIIRGIYRYHTKTLGWFDIAYNFLIDKYGRAWEGRSGGINKLVRGAHTLGFNHQSVGIALIGSFNTTRPSNAALIKTERLAAWKLDYAGRNPAGKIRTISHGSDRFKAGRHVTVWVIDGHRDTNETSCPGGALYKWLPWIRKYAAKRAHMFNP